MPALYVVEPRCTLRQDGEALAVTRDGPDGGREVLLRLPSHRVESVGLVGDAHITADAVRLCLGQGIAVAWFGPGGRLQGRLTPEAPRSADLRLAQYAAAVDPAGALGRARPVVVAKVRNAAAVLAGLQGNYPGEPALAAGPDLAALADRAAAATDFPQLLGLEGAAARCYFQALAAGFRGPIRFNGRAHRPPPDPANALLSFGYVLLANQLAGLLEARGLDPALGFFHGVRPGRPSLALDLLEEFRHPVVDRFVLRVCNLRVLRPEQFETDPERAGGVRLTADGRRRFFAEWEKFLTRPMRLKDGCDPQAVRPLLRRQVERLAVDLRGGPAYLPLAYGG